MDRDPRLQFARAFPLSSGLGIRRYCGGRDLIFEAPASCRLARRLAPEGGWDAHRITARKWLRLGLDCRHTDHLRATKLGPDYFLFFRRRPSPLLSGGHAGRSAPTEKAQRSQFATRATAGALTAEASGWTADAAPILPSIPINIEDSAPASAGTVSCSSDDGRRHYCTVESGGRVRLQQQRGDSPCREGYSWGSDGKVIWVDHGCRADFAVEGGRGAGEGQPEQDFAWTRKSYAGAPNAGGQNQVVSCSSDDNAPALLPGGHARRRAAVKAAQRIGLPPGPQLGLRPQRNLGGPRLPSRLPGLCFEIRNLIRQTTWTRLLSADEVRKGFLRPSSCVDRTARRVPSESCNCQSSYDQSITTVT